MQNHLPGRQSAFWRCSTIAWQSIPDVVRRFVSDGYLRRPGDSPRAYHVFKFRRVKESVKRRDKARAMPRVVL